MTVRSLFISDVHLGSKFSKAKDLLNFIRRFEQDLEYLYIVGDFIDGWKLSRKWYWDDHHNFVIRKVLGLIKEQGTKVYYISGNHDEFLRHFAHDYGSVNVLDEIIHTTVDGRKLLVIHGDQFDVVIRNAKILGFIGDIGYEMLIHVNEFNNWIRHKLGLPYWSLSKTVKQGVKEAVNFIGSFEYHLSQYTKKEKCDGVICGHIHTPKIETINNILYCNTGDWVESGSAIVEHLDGRLELFTDQIDIYLHEKFQGIQGDENNGSDI